MVSKICTPQSEYIVKKFHYPHLSHEGPHTFCLALFLNGRDGDIHKLKGKSLYRKHIDDTEEKG